MIFIDTSVWLAFFLDAHQKAEEVITGNDVVFSSILTLFEIKKRLLKLKTDKNEITSLLGLIKRRSIIVEISEEIIERGVEVSLQHNLSAIDALIYASALETEVALISCDNDFRGLPDTEIIDP